MSDLPPPPGPVGGAGGQYPPAAPGPGPYGPPPGQQYPPPGPPPGQPFGAPTNYMAPMGGGRPKANFGQRLVAWFIDGIVTAFLTIPAFVVLFNGDKEFYQCSSDLEETSSGAFICERPTSSTYALFFVLLAVGAIGSILYYALMEGRGATVGKRVAGIAVVDQMTGQPIGVGRAVGRTFAKMLSGLVCLLGYLWMLWDPNQQTWHDKMTSSVVVQS